MRPNHLELKMNLCLFFPQGLAIGASTIVETFGWAGPMPEPVHKPAEGFGVVVDAWFF